MVMVVRAACVKYALHGMPQEVFVELCGMLMPKWDRANVLTQRGDGHGWGQMRSGVLKKATTLDTWQAVQTGSNMYDERTNDEGVTQATARQED